MIIIKSQDGDKIIKVESVVIDSQVNRSIGGLTSSSVYYILGNYESKERVKEVMEEIEDHICSLYADKCIMNELSIDAFSRPAYELFDRIKKESKNYIFKMPKE